MKARKTCGTPCALAKSACSLKCNGSPCAGTAIFGLHPGIHFRHFRPARDDRIRAPARCGRSPTSTPAVTKALMILPTAFSLPGMVRDEKITVSPAFNSARRMVVGSDARERRARLALAAGGEGQNPLARQALERAPCLKTSAGRRASRIHERRRQRARSLAQEYRPAVRRRGRPRPQRAAGRRWKRRWSRSTLPFALPMSRVERLGDVRARRRFPLRATCWSSCR